MSNIRKANVHPTTRQRLVTLAVAGACATLATPALAQEAAAPAATAPAATTDLGGPSGVATSTVTVTGIRASMQSTLNLKKNSDGIVDGIVADDIGKFPDTNLAEAVQRISGVSIDRQNGEGSRVTVRGIGPDMNLVLLNGRQMPSANLGDRGSRSFDFANLASEAVSQIQVYKSARADTPPGGVGATLNIMTGRPLDLGNQTSIGAKALYDRSNTNLPDMVNGKRITPEVSALISRKFGADDMFGLSLSASYQSRNSGSAQAAIPNGWNGPFQAGDATSQNTIPADGRGVTNPPKPGEIYSIPQNLSYFLNGQQRQRTNAQLTLQFRPTRDLTTTLDYTYARNKVQTIGAELNAWFNHPLELQSSVFEKSGIINSPTNYQEDVRGQDLSMFGHNYATKSELKSIGLNTQFRINLGLKLSLDLHHSVAESGSDSPYGVNNVLGTASFGRNTTGIDFTHEMPVLYIQADPMPFEPTGGWFQDARVKQTIDQVQFSGGLKIGDTSNLNFGASGTRTRFKSAWQNVQQDKWQGTLPSHADAARYYDQSNWVPFEYARYFSKLGGSGDPKLFPTMVYVDFPAVLAQMIQVRAATANQPASLFGPRLDDPSEVRDLEEKSNALYAQFNTDWDTAMPMHTGIGLRYEKTRVKSRAIVQTPDRVDWVSQNEFPIHFIPGTLQTQEGEYHNWLPSVDWDMDVLSNLKVRASYGVTIGRPRWSDIQGGATYGPNASVIGTTKTEGNPRLTPVKSKNIDLSAEWYYTKQSMVSLGLYHKDLKGYAGAVTLVQPSPTATTPVGGKYWNEAVNVGGCNRTNSDCLRDYILGHFAGQPGVVAGPPTGSGHLGGTITGIPGDPPLPYNLNTIVNQDAATLKGAEVNWQHMFDNGFGFQANYTYVKSDLTYKNDQTGPQFALQGYSNSANLVGIFENKDWSVRLAYNWRDKFLYTTAENNRPNPGYTEPYGQVDLSVGYNVNRNLSLSLEGINLGNSTLRNHGRTERQVLSVTQTGPRYMVGARYKF